MSEVKVKPPARTISTWAGDERFDSGLPGGATFRTDGRRETGPSPVDALLCALASCSGIDVAEILAKRRTPVESMTIEAVGDRAAAVPPRVTKIVLAFTIRGKGIERVHAERAIELAVTKYCSVRDTLDRNMPITWTLDLSE